jgi:hypothetical protein
LHTVKKYSRFVTLIECRRIIRQTKIKGMKTEFSRQYLIDYCGCYNEEPGKIEGLLGDRTSVILEEILESEISLKDKAWFVAHSCELSNSEVKQLLLKLTRIVLPIFEEEYPDDTRVRECLIATEGFLNGTVTEEEFNKKKSEAYSAYFDTDDYCADTVAPYWDAAFSAYWAARAATATYAASSAYCAVIAAEGKPDYEQKIFNELKKLK